MSASRRSVISRRRGQRVLPGLREESQQGIRRRLGRIAAEIRLARRQILSLAQLVDRRSAAADVEVAAARPACRDAGIDMRARELECPIALEVVEIAGQDVAENEIDLATAVDAAIRDLHEILMFWGSEGARQRAQDCEQMLRRAYSESVAGQSDWRL